MEQPITHPDASDHAIVRWFRLAWYSGRQIVALFVFVTAFTIFAVPFLVAVQLGHDCPSHDRLDEMIDDAMKTSG